MSSANLVKLSIIEESAYGVTPVAGNFQSLRFNSEKLSGSPETTESAQIRTDRMSSGQVVTSLNVGGTLDFELAKDTTIEKLMASAMLSDWVVSTLKTVDLTIDVDTKKITRATGSFITDGVVVGDFITLAGFVGTNNNKIVMVSKVIDATNINYVGPAGMTDEAGSGTTFKVLDKLSIGSTQKSFSIEKDISDLTDKAIIYKGMLVSEMNLKVNYGEILNGTFNFSGNGYEAVDSAADFITNGRTIDDPATSNSMNGSVDMPYLASSAVGELSEASFCINSVEISLNNNYTAQNCIGMIAPKSYSPGSAAIAININSYLSNENWDILQNKLSQTPFAIGFAVQNTDGFYGFYVPAVQVSMDDPSAGGANQDVMLEMSGVGRVGLNGESALTIYRA